MYEYIVNVMKKIKVASRRINRSCATWALSITEQLVWRENGRVTVRYIPKRTMVAEKVATIVENPHSFMIAYTTGTVRLPKTAGSARNPT